MGVIYMNFKKEKPTDIRSGEQIEFVVERDCWIKQEGEVLIVSAPQSLVAAKLRAARQRPERKAAAEAAPDLAGVNYQYFLDLNAKLAKSGKRSAAVTDGLKCDLEKLRIEFGVAALNAAIAKIHNPEQARPQYIRAICKSQQRKESISHVTSRYTNTIDSACAALSGVRAGD